MFKINLSSFKVEKEFFIEVLKNDLEFEKDVKINYIKLNITLRKDKNTSVIITGKLKSSLTLECSRCLSDFEKVVEINITTVYKDKNVFSDDDKKSEINIYENNIIDLYDYIRQTLILEIPIKPLCTNTCKGLCPICGTNLNENKCDCNREKYFSLNL